MHDTQYDQFHVFNGVVIESFRTAEGEGASYRKADAFKIKYGKGAEVYIADNSGEWWKRSASKAGISYWDTVWSVDVPKMLLMYRLVNQ